MVNIDALKILDLDVHLVQVWCPESEFPGPVVLLDPKIKQKQ